MSDWPKADFHPHARRTAEAARRIVGLNHQAAAGSRGTVEIRLKGLQGPVSAGVDGGRASRSTR